MNKCSLQGKNQAMEQTADQVDFPFEHFPAKKIQIKWGQKKQSQKI